jgi:hypothetical protein
MPVRTASGKMRMRVLFFRGRRHVDAHEPRPLDRRCDQAGAARLVEDAIDEIE